MNEKVDLRIIKTHAKLKDALAQMMNVVSFDDITVFDLCERAGVRRATFYKHFKDKYDFLRSVIASVINDISSALFSNEHNLLSPVDYFTNFVNEILEYFNNRPVILANLLGSNTFPIIFDIITSCTQSSLVNDLSNAKQYGVGVTTDILFTANFINGGISKILLEWFKNPTISKEELTEKVAEILAKFFC